jgi:hypothetical protein
MDLQMGGKFLTVEDSQLSKKGYESTSKKHGSGQGFLVGTIERENKS